MKRILTLLTVLPVAGSLLVSCSNNPSATDTTVTSAGTSAATSSAPTGGAMASSNSLSEPKGSIAYQLDLVKAGDADKLKTCLTPRLRERITPELLSKAKSEAGKYTIDDLYASAEMGESDGKKTAKVKMKNGRTLTTLVETDGQWLADTIWFK